MSESPKAEHQKGADLRLQATDLQREMKKGKKGEKGNKKNLQPSNIQLSNYQNITRPSRSLSRCYE